MATNRSGLAQGSGRLAPVKGGTARSGGVQAVARTTSSGGRGAAARGRLPMATTPSDSASRGVSESARQNLRPLGR